MKLSTVVLEEIFLLGSEVDNHFFYNIGLKTWDRSNPTWQLFALRRTASFDVLSVIIGLTDSPVGEFKNQKSVVNFEQDGCIYYLYVEQKPRGGLSPIFLTVGVHDVITPFKFGDDRFTGFGLAEGQSLPFPLYFEGRPYNTHTIVWGVTSLPS